MRKFNWIEWNLQKISAHGLSVAEVEAAFDRVLILHERTEIGRASCRERVYVLV